MPEIVERRDARPLGVFEWSMLAILCVACIATIAVLGTKLTFFNDDWYFLLQRPGLESGGGIDVLLAPHNSNGVVLTALAYKALVAMFGFGPQLPYRLLVGIIVAAAGVLVFAFVRARSGRLIALAAAAVVMFMGAAWEDLLFFAAGIDQVGAVATGLGALLVLERHDRSGGALACILLVCSIGFSNVGVPFVLAAAVALSLRGEFSRLWVAAVPGVLFAFWWAFYGVKQPSHITIANVEHLPRYVFDSLSIGLASLTGLNGGAAALARGHVLSLIALAAVIVCLLRGGRPRWQLAVPACAAATFWVLTGASFIPGREPTASRYQLVDVTLLILIIAELLWSVRWTPLRTGIVAVLACPVVVSNITVGLVHGYRFLRTQSQYVRADLGALRIARSIDPADVWLLDPIAHTTHTCRASRPAATSRRPPPTVSRRGTRSASCARPPGPFGSQPTAC
jgi:hypothetical protein